MSELQSGEDKWIEELYKQNYERMYAIGLIFVGNNSKQRQIVEDVIQEVFLTLMRKKQKLKDHPKIEGWLIVTLRLKLGEHIKRMSKDEKWILFSFNDENADNTALKDMYQDAGLEKIILEEKYDAIRNLIGKKNMKLFDMYCIQKKSAKEVAKELNMTENAVWVQVNRIRKKLLNNHELFILFIILFFYM